MNYNTQQPHLIIPEYGRNIQSMVEHCCTLKSREDRNRCARVIIQVMGQLHPHLRDVPATYFVFIPTLLLINLVGLSTSNRRVHAALSVTWLIVIIGYEAISSVGTISAV